MSADDMSSLELGLFTGACTLSVLSNGFLIYKCVFQGDSIMYWGNIIPYSLLSTAAVAVEVARTRKKKRKAAAAKAVPVPPSMAVPVSGVAPVPASAVPAPPKKVTPSISVPLRTGNAYMVYHYNNVRFVPVPDPEPVLGAIVADGTYELEVVESGEVSYRGQPLGQLSDRVGMVADFLRRGEIVRAWLENCGESGNYVYLAFYRDYVCYYSGKPLDVYKLRKYSGDEAQMNLSYAMVGDRVELDDDFDAVNVTTDGGFIGCLPQKATEKFADVEQYDAFISAIDDTEDGYVPIISVYW